MKRGLKVLLVIILVLLAAAGGVFYWQRDNISAIQASRKYSPEELRQQITENQRQVQELMDAHPEVSVRDLTEQERDALKNGKLSPDELARLLVGDPGGAGQQEENVEPAVPGEEAPDGQSETAAPPGEPEETAAPDFTYNEELSALVARTYVLRAEFENQLSGMEGAARAAYRALPEEERTTSALVDLVFGYYDTMVAMEAQCDAEMQEIVEKMRGLIEANGGDASFPDSVWEAYENEKALKKSQYLAELESRGIL